MKSRSAGPARAGDEGARGLKHQIRIVARQTGVRTRESKFARRGRRDDESISESDGGDDRYQIVKAVRATSGNRKEEVDLGWCEVRLSHAGAERTRTWADAQAFRAVRR